MFLDKADVSGRNQKVPDSFLVAGDTDNAAHADLQWKGVVLFVVLVYHESMGSQIAMNPIARKRDQLGLTQEELAEWTGISRGYIIRLEQGTVTKPSWNFLNAITQDSHSASKILETYELWRKEKRASQYELAVLNFCGTDWEGDWLKLRKSFSISRVGFCKQFCIHPGVMENFEKKPREKFTPYLYEVWDDVGLDKATVEWAEAKMRGFIHV